MRRLTPGRAALLVAVVSALVYANAVGNGWVLDDQRVIRSNPAAQSLSGAWAARFSPYWPPENGLSAGLYRPAAIMSYAIDWSLSGGSPAWFHAHNVLLHALVAALVVVIAAAWLPPVGALATGLLFALHPVHVEAVANVVGRAEILAALGLLLGVLAFRRYRAAETDRRRAAWGCATVAAVSLALLSKEHAVAAVVILGLDALLLPGPARRPVFGLLLAVTAVTLAWLAVWRSVAGGGVELSAATALHGLSWWERLATMGPAYLDVLRLLTWPMDLSLDYSPQVIPQRTTFTGLAVLGLAASTAAVLLGALSVRRAPAIAFGVLTGLATYAPTANVVFASGTLLAERTLYFAALAPALAMGWLVSRGVARRRRATLLGVVAVWMVFGVRTWTRTPVWRDSYTALVETVLQHPESYRARLQLGRQLELSGAAAPALAEYLVAGSLFERDAYVAMYSVPLALRSGRTRVALAEARRAWELRPVNAAIGRLRVEALLAAGLGDSARLAAREGVDRAAHKGMSAATYRHVLELQRAPAWQRSLAEARVAWWGGRLGQATRWLDSTAVALRAAAGAVEELCWEIGNMEPVMAALRPTLLADALSRASEAGLGCAEEGLRETSGLAN